MINSSSLIGSMPTSGDFVENLVSGWEDGANFLGFGVTGGLGAGDSSCPFGKPA
jgi:hypothetical protein